MKITLHYGDGVLALPAAALTHLARADANAIRILLCLAASSAETITREELAAVAGIDLTSVDAAVAFWCGTGILDIDSRMVGTVKSDTLKKPTKPQKPAKLPASEEPDGESAPPHSSASSKGEAPAPPSAPPRYTTEELGELLERRRELRSFIEECSNVLGKVLSAHETNILLSLIDYLNLDSEYVLLLLAHCVKIGKKSVRYAETCAISLYDSGITDIPALQEKLKQQEILEEAEGQIRTMFGMRSRALTSKEQKMMETWLLTWHFDLDIIRRAYEITVNATQNPSVPYANSIMERWAAAGLHTLSEIEAADAEREGKKASASPDSSFDIDDFFQAALRRSFGDDYVPPQDLSAPASGKKMPKGK